jgi:hypothetical protein
MYKLNFYVPQESKEEVKEALFAIGVGMFDNYECCAWETKGMGQFKPIGNANPHIGKLNELEVLEEYKVELICHDHLIQQAVKVLKEAHPYEEVAYEVFKMEAI